MSRNSPFRILHVNSCFGTQRGDQGAIHEIRSHSCISVTEQILDLLTILLIEELSLAAWSFLLPRSDGICDVVGNPNPEWATVLARRNMQIADPRSALLPL